MGLSKTLEDAVQSIGGNADARVADGKANGTGNAQLFVIRDSDDDGSFL